MPADIRKSDAINFRPLILPGVRIAYHGSLLGFVDGGCTAPSGEYIPFDLGVRRNLTVPMQYSHVQLFPQKKISKYNGLCRLLPPYASVFGHTSASGCHSDLRVRTQTFIPCTCRIYLLAFRAAFCVANSPTLDGLLCDFCSSGQNFAASFLQIPPRDEPPCSWLILLVAKRMADFHRRVCAHTGRTNKRGVARP